MLISDMRCTQSIAPRWRAAGVLVSVLFAVGVQARPLHFQHEVGYALRTFTADASSGPPTVSSSERWQQTLSLRTQFDASTDDDAWRLHGDVSLRADDLDDHRTALDVRELYISYASHSLQVSAGLRRVFWGVTEFVHQPDVRTR